MVRPWSSTYDVQSQLDELRAVKQVHVQQWLQEFCVGAPGVAAALVSVATDAPSLATVARWPADEPPAVELLVAAKVVLKTGKPLSHVPPRLAGDPDDRRRRIIAVPITSHGRLAAAVAIATATDNKVLVDQSRRALQSAVGHFGKPAKDKDARRKLDGRASLRLLAALLRQPGFADSAAGAATELATLLQADRGTVGWIEQRQAQIVATSHAADLDGRRQAARALAEAMDEAISQREIVAYPPQPDDPPRITLAHAAVVNAQGGTVCTVPLAAGRKLVGALLIENARPIALDAPLRAFLEHSAALLGLILELKHRAEAPWHLRLRQRLRAALARLTQRGHLGTKLAVGGVALLAAALLLVPVTYRVGAPAHLEGSTQRALVAPADGYLRQAHVRPGDAVRTDQVLVEMADEEPLLEVRKWESALAQHQSALGSALAATDRAQLVIHQAKVAEAQAQLELAQQRVARSRIVAPFDGVVIRGDLNQALGSPVKRGDLLLMIAPRDQFRIIVRADERDIADLREGQSGHLALTAMPDETFPIEVQRITPVARAEDGRNFFEVEARLTKPPPRTLRPGLEGVAKIEAGWQPLAWIWGRRLFNGLRMQLWAWGL